MGVCCAYHSMRGCKYILYSQRGPPGKISKRLTDPLKTFSGGSSNFL
nr:MAG TPA_asm: hypothetical protein [Caudoviricetes sp.]